MRFAEAGEHGAGNHYRTAQASAFALERLPGEVVLVYVVGLEGYFAFAAARHFHTHVFQQLYEEVDVDDVGDIGIGDGLAGEEGSAEHLQGFILCALRNDGTMERTAAADFKGCGHNVGVGVK